MTCREGVKASDQSSSIKCRADVWAREPEQYQCNSGYAYYAFNCRAKRTTYGIPETIDDEDHHGEPPGPPSTEERPDTRDRHDCREAEEAQGRGNSCAQELLVFFRLDAPHGIEEGAGQK